MKVKMVNQPAGTNEGKAWPAAGKEVDVADERAQELVNTGMAVPVDPDAVVDVPSKLVAEAQARHDFAETEYATPQERRQAATEQAYVDDLHPQGSFAQLHEANMLARHVVDEGHAKKVAVNVDEIAAVQGQPVADSPAAPRKTTGTAKDDKK